MSVTCDGEHISGSPFIVVVGEGVGTVKATNSRIFGIESHKRIVTNEEVAFTIDTANSSGGLSFKREERANLGFLSTSSTY